MGHLRQLLTAGLVAVGISVLVLPASAQIIAEAGANKCCVCGQGSTPQVCFEDQDNDGECVTECGECGLTRVLFDTNDDCNEGDVADDCTGVPILADSGASMNMCGTPLPTLTQTRTQTATQTPTRTNTITNTPVPPTATRTSTNTNTPAGPTNTPTETPTQTATRTGTSTRTETETPTPVNTATATQTQTASPTFGGDADGDGIDDTVEGFDDRDGDGIPDYLDYDPTGYIYDEITGEIVPGGLVTLGGAASFVGGNDGSGGFYQFIADMAGVVTLGITAPPGCQLSTICTASAGPFDPTGGPPPCTNDGGICSLGAGEDDATGVLGPPAPACTAFFLSFDLDPASDPPIINNNIPVRCRNAAPAPAISGWGYALAVLLMGAVAFVALLRRRAA